MPVFYDTHAHLDFPDFKSGLPDVLERAKAAGIEKIICVGTDLESSRQAIALSEAHPMLYAAAGWHPTHMDEVPDDIREPLAELAKHPRVVAIGETGLDYYRMPSQQAGGTAEEDEAYRRKQLRAFEQQLEVAAEAGMNVIVHQRGEVLKETLEVMQPFTGQLKGQFHCFAGSTDDLSAILEVGCLVSFTGILTFKNGQNVRDALSAAPPGRFMLETDSPFLAPVPYRGKRCEPAYVAEIAAKAAEVRGCSLEELSRQTCETAHAFFPKLAL